MFNFRLAQEFRKRAADMMAPFPRGAVSTSASVSSVFDNSRMGAYAALGAIGLGGVMLVANIAHNRCEIPIAAAPSDQPAVAAQPSKPAVVAKALPTPEPDALSVAAAPAPAIPDKSTVRVDTSTTGAIAAEPPAHLKHKAKLKKAKEKGLDSRN